LLGNPGAGLCLVAEAPLQITKKRNAGDFLSSILVQFHPKVHEKKMLSFFKLMNLNKFKR
jgi:hypothetical protein